MNKPNPDSVRAVLKAMEIIGGGQSALARACGVTQPAVHKWLKGGKIEGENILAIARITGQSPYEFDPKRYPDPAWVPPTYSIATANE